MVMVDQKNAVEQRQASEMERVETIWGGAMALLVISLIASADAIADWWVGVV